MIVSVSIAIPHSAQMGLDFSFELSIIFLINDGFFWRWEFDPESLFSEWLFMWISSLGCFFVKSISLLVFMAFLGGVFF